MAFWKQFFPAFVAGALVLLLTLILQRPEQQAGSLRAETFEYYINNDDLKIDNFEHTSGINIKIIRIYNFTDQNFRDFSIAMDGFRGFQAQPSSINIEPEFRGVFSNKTVDSSLIGSDGIIRIPISKFDAGGELTLRVLGNIGTISNIQTSNPNIEIENIAKFSVQNRETGPSAIIFFLGLVSSILTTLSTYMFLRFFRR